MKMIIGKSYEIKWIDTFSFNGWYSEKDLKRRSKEAESYMTSVGMFAGEYNGFIILCSTHCPALLSNSPYGHPNWIPKGCIKKIKELK